jgi:hypothetical protein
MTNIAQTPAKAADRVEAARLAVDETNRRFRSSSPVSHPGSQTASPGPRVS